MIASTPAPLRKDLPEQTTWRSVLYRYMVAFNGVAPDPIKLNDQEVRITVRMDYFARKIILFLSQLQAKLHAKVILFVYYFCLFPKCWLAYLVKIRKLFSLPVTDLALWNHIKPFISVLIYFTQACVIVIVIVLHCQY